MALDVHVHVFLCMYVYMLTCPLSLSLSLSLLLLLLLSFPYIACMREQLAQALASQQALIIERDQAKEQCRLAQDRANKVQKQLDLLRKVHSEQHSTIIWSSLVYDVCVPALP